MGSHGVRGMSSWDMRVAEAMNTALIFARSVKESREQLDPN